MKSKVEAQFQEATYALEWAGWMYLGCDKWRDPITMEVFLTHTARDVAKARAGWSYKKTKAKKTVRRNPKADFYLKLLKLVMPMARRSMSCEHPIEVDEDEYVACLKCDSCKTRYEVAKLKLNPLYPKDI